MSAKRIDRKEVYKGKIFTVAEDTIEFSDGKIAKWDVVLHNGAAAVVPITKNGEVILVRQFRNAENGSVLEIPAGKLEKDEDPLECAKRELEEEIGYKSNRIQKICSMYSAIGFSNEKLHLYMATDLKLGEQNLDEDEYIEIEKYTLEESIKMIFTGEIKDSKTIVGLLAVNEILRQ